MAQMAQTAEQLLHEMDQPNVHENGPAENNLLNWRSPRNIDQVIYCTCDGTQIKFIDKNHNGDHWMPHVSQIGEPFYTARCGEYFVAATVDRIDNVECTDNRKEVYIISCYICVLDRPVIHCNDQHRLTFTASAEIANISLSDLQLCVVFRDGSVRKISLITWQHRKRSNSL